MARLTLEQRQRIVTEYEDGASLRDLSEKYTVGHTTIKRIVEHAGVLRDRSGIYLKPNRTKTFEDLQIEILKILPNATFTTNADGDVIIHTGLRVAKVEVLLPIE